MVKVTCPSGSMRIKASGRRTYLAGAASASARPTGNASSNPPPAARLTFRNSRRDGATGRSIFPAADIAIPNAELNCERFLRFSPKQRKSLGNWVFQPAVSSACDRNPGSRVALMVSHAAFAKRLFMHMNIIMLQPLVALIFRILILILPRLLHYLIAIYLILIGLAGLFPHLFTSTV